MSNLEPISLDGVKSYSLKERSSKISIDELGRPWKAGKGLQFWMESLPKILAAKDFRKIVNAIIRAARSDKVFLLAMGAHAIKVGLNPIILDLLDRNIISGIAMNGAGIVHDTELAMVGRTSEDVADQLGEGKFGMAEETGRFLNEAIIEGAESGLGLGRSVGAKLVHNETI